MIRAKFVDAAALGARTPAEISTYLRSRGWWYDRREGVAAIWLLDLGDDEWEIAQPLDPALRDYAARVSDILGVLAAAENRSQLDILQAISDTLTDVHTVRLFPPDLPPGLIGIEDAALAYESVRAW